MQINLYCQHTKVEIKYLSNVEIKLSHTASGGLNNLQTSPNIMNGEQSVANCLSHDS
jgi:hypothetical protein